MNTSEKAEFTASIHCIEIFKIKNTDLQFRSPGHDWQKNEKMRKNTGNCKTLYVSHKRNNPKVCFFMEYLVSQDWLACYKLVVHSKSYIAMKTYT